MTTRELTPFPPAVLGDSGRFVADAMIACPTTHEVGTELDEIRAFFQDDHVHIALVVGTDRRLVTTIERPDLPASSAGRSPAADLGTLTGRTVPPSAALDAVTGALVRARRRRMAVVDDRGRLLGLLCLKKGGTGYCSDDDINQRAAEAKASFATTAIASSREPPPGRGGLCRLCWCGGIG